MQPGESGKIPVKMASGRFSGHMGKSITVVTNVAGEGNNVTLKIEGDVWQALEAKPPSASFGRLTMDAAKDPTRVQKLTILNNVTDDAKLAFMRCSNPAFRVETAVLEPGKRFEVTVGFATTPQVGNLAGNIELSTGVDEMPTLSIPVNAYITPDVEVMPPNLTLPQDLPMVTSRQLYIQNNANTPIQVSDLQTSNPDIKLALEEMQPGKKYKLNVEVPAGYKAPPGGDRISFKTDNSTAPEMTVRVTQVVPPAGAKAGITAGRQNAETKNQPATPTKPRTPAASGARAPTLDRAKAKEVRQQDVLRASPKIMPESARVHPTSMPSPG